MLETNKKMCPSIFPYSPPSVWRLFDFPLSRSSFLPPPPPPQRPPPYRRPVQSAAPIGDDGQLMSFGPPVLWLSTNAVQLAVPIGDDGQLMSFGPPVLWLSTDAVQLTVPIGDDGQLMSSSSSPRPVL